MSSCYNMAPPPSWFFKIWNFERLVASRGLNCVTLNFVAISQTVAQISRFFEGWCDVDPQRIRSYFWGLLALFHHSINNDDSTFGENRPRNATGRVHTDRQTDAVTETNWIYNLSHAICYTYGADKNIPRLNVNFNRLRGGFRFSIAQKHTATVRFQCRAF